MPAKESIFFFMFMYVLIILGNLSKMPSNYKNIDKKVYTFIFCRESNILFWIILCGQSLIQHGMPHETIVVLAGLTNTYSDYIATYEEYQVRTVRGGSVKITCS